MGARERLPMGQVDVRDGGAGRAPRGTEVVAHAAKGGNLEVLQWARANGCPWDERTRRVARGDILEWAVANGVPDK